ncbi:leucine-rich repeat extensin-like protein 4 [Iris pallida]|uniref:Leucine-rich repeat extensin-like protein 4 n=1 Tax=Iris pallida TaxID=29817 RepID=A0AAX6HYQ5_IRIPA|nr:leucine-rich repeat extensin-like protein 4 [Iris pallida]
MQAITTTISMQATTTIISAAVPAAIGRAWPRIRRARRAAPPRATARTGAAAAAAFAASARARVRACTPLPRRRRPHTDVAVPPMAHELRRTPWVSHPTLRCDI